MRPGAVLLAVAAALALAACAPVDEGTGPGVLPRSANPSAERVAVVGDSITDVQSPDFAAGEIDPESWVSEILDEDRVFAGGWAQWAATTEQMAAAVEPLDADVLVILAGTNDMALRVPFAETAANLAAIADTVGAPRVVVSAIPPLDRLPEEPERFNSRLERFVLEKGWEWVDPMERIRSGGEYRPGMSDDGIHPTETASRLIGQAIEDAVWPDDAEGT